MRPENKESSLRPLSELTRWDRNYHVGNVEEIIASIVRFGYNGSLRVWKDGIVMAGNHALIALETMHANGAKPPRGIEVKNKKWFVPTVDVSHLSRTEAAAFALADNRIPQLGKDDPERLIELLSEVEAFEGTGYTRADLDDLLARAKEPAFNPVESDEQPRLDNKAPVKCPECGTQFVPTKA